MTCPLFAKLILGQSLGAAGLTRRRLIIVPIFGASLGVRGLRLPGFVHEWTTSVRINWRVPVEPVVIDQARLRTVASSLLLLLAAVLLTTFLALASVPASATELRNSTTAGNVPTLSPTQPGEVAINRTDGRLFAWNAAMSGVLSWALQPAGAWTAYSPAITAGDGTALTTGAVSARYQIVGKTMRLHLDVPITTGAGSGGTKVALPAGVTLQGFERQSGFDSGSDAGGANTPVWWLGNAGNGYVTAYFQSGPLNHTGVSNARLIGTMQFEVQ